MTTKIKASVLADTTVSTGTYGGSTQHSVFTVDAQGRLTYAGNATPSIANTQITGVMNANQIANNQTFGINISGQAATANNGVVTTSSYTDPSWLSISKTKVGLGNVDNTADANKAVLSAGSATNATNAANLVTTNFTVTQSGSKLIFKYGTTTILSIDSNGAVIALSDVSAGGTP